MANKEMYEWEQEFLSKYPYRLSRKFEEQLPEFQSHDEARTYFKNDFGSNFQLNNSEEIDEEKVYFYYLIVHKENFYKFQKEMRKNGYSSGTEGMMSYHSVEIWDDGRVHIVY